MKGQISIFDFLQQENEDSIREPTQKLTAVKESPCSACDVKNGSLTCFIRRGYVITYGERGRFAKSSDGVYLREPLEVRQCKVTYDWEPQYEREQRIIKKWASGAISAEEFKRMWNQEHEIKTEE